MNNGGGENRCADDVGGETEVYSVSPDGNVTYSNNEPATPRSSSTTAVPSRNVLPTPSCSFKSEWQSFPEFKSWLHPVLDDRTKAWCQACEKVFKADLKSLRVHGVGRSHVRMVRQKFPDAVDSSPPPAAVYNVITDRKGTYGLGILSKTENNPTAGSTLYVNPTNPNTNVLTCDPKQDKDNFVIVSMPKGELATGAESQRREMPEQHSDSQPAARKKLDAESKAGAADQKSRNAYKRAATPSAAGAANSAGVGAAKAAKTTTTTTCESFAEELIDTEGTVSEGHKHMGRIDPRPQTSPRPKKKVRI